NCRHPASLSSILPLTTGASCIPSAVASSASSPRSRLAPRTETIARLNASPKTCHIVPSQRKEGRCHVQKDFGAGRPGRYRSSEACVDDRGRNGQCIGRIDTARQPAFHDAGVSCRVCIALLLLPATHL